MRCRGVNSLGWFWNRSPPARAQSDPTPGDYFRQMWWWRCPCLCLCPLPLGDEFWEGSCGEGSAYHEQPESLPASQGWARRHGESQVQSHQEGKKARFQVLLGTLVDNEGQPIHEVSPVTQRQPTHKSVSVRSDYLRGKWTRSRSLLIAEPSVNLQLEKKNQSRQRNVRTKAWWLRGRSGLPKSSEASSFKCSFQCYWEGAGRGGADSLYFLDICYCGKRITNFLILFFNPKPLLRSRATCPTVH